VYKRYQALADQTPGVEFVGRLATYRYYNMDQVVAQALSVFDRLAGAKPVRGADPPAPVELTVVASGARAS
jgi:UDP-galactopyranose mutase